MRTANNNSNFTVEALVAKYRNYVKEHCPKTLACAPTGEFVEISNPHYYMETLLLSLYTSAAGDKVNKNVVNALTVYSHLYQEYYKEALTNEEYEFLLNNFALFVDNLVSVYPFSEVLSQPSRISLIKKYLLPQKGGKFLIANTGLDVPCLFPDCTYKGYFGTDDNIERWAFGQILLFAKGVQQEIETCVFYEGIGYKTLLPEKNSLDYIVYGAHEDITYDDILSLYETLAPNGRMLIFVDKTDMQSKDDNYRELRNRLVEDRSISTIVSYGDSESLTRADVIRLLLVIDKKENNITKICSLPLKKEIEIESSKLNPDCLWPGYYFAVRPENGIMLSCLASCPSRKDELKHFKELLGGKFQWDVNGDDLRLVLPEWMLNLSMAIASDLSSEYKDANLCNKNLLLVSDSSMDYLRNTMRVVEQPCVLLAAAGDTTRKLSIGFFDNVNGIKFARAKGMPCLFPKEGIDVKYLAAILLLPVVKEQILAICDGSLYGTNIDQMLDMVIVPEYDEKERLSFLAETNYEALTSSQEELKQESEQYRKSIRMRKHALTQSLSSVEAMFYALNSYREKHDVFHNEDVISRIKKTTVSEAFEYIARGLKDLMPALEHIAEVEYTFEKPEWIDPEKFIEDYIRKSEKGWLNFKHVVTWEQGHNQAVEDLKDPVSGDIIIRRGDSLNLFLFPKDALERVFNNIISNAKAHGFGDKSRNDYQVRFSWYTDGISLTIEIDNNGSPIPSDRNTASLLEYGVSTDLHCNGHNGIGCNEIDDIMKRYDGKIEIVSLPGNEFSVKYILTFNRSNNIRLL